MTTPTNRPPVAVDDTATLAEDQAITLRPLENDSDPDGDPLSIVNIGTAAHGTVVLNGTGNLRYTPGANFAGTDLFTYTISDRRGGLAQATVRLTITPVNDPPTAQDDTASLAEDSSATISVLANDSDPDGESPVLVSVGLPQHGTATAGSAGTIFYRPSPNYHGDDSFQYTIADANGRTATATVRVTVTPVNDAPQAEDDAASTAQGVPVTIAVLLNDTDVDGQSLTVIRVGAPDHGQSTIVGTDQVRYAPAADFVGLDAFTYTVSDGSGGVVATDTATVTILVAPVGNIFIAVDDRATTPEDTTITIAVLANDRHVDGAALQLVQVGQAGHGRAIREGNQVRYTPDANYFGTDSFTYMAATAAGAGRSGAASATVTVTITPVNDPPTAQADTAQTNRNVAVAVAVLANDSDPDGDSLRVVGFTPAQHGKVSRMGSGLRYTPDTDYAGADQFDYTVGDNHGGAATGRVTIAVAPADAADLAVLGWENGVSVLSGQVFTRPLTVINRGPGEASGVVVTITLESGLEVAGQVQDAVCDAADNIITCSLGTLPANGRIALNLPLHLRPDGGSVGGSAAVSGRENDPNLLDNQWRFTVDEMTEQVGYADDFAGGVGPGWSTQSRSTAPNGRTFLGEFGNTEPGAVRLTLTDLPPHRFVTVAFDLLILRSWDGNRTAAPANFRAYQTLSAAQAIGPDRWRFLADGRPLVDTTFTNWSSFRQAYPDDFPRGDHPAHSAATEVLSLGYAFNDLPQDSVYRIVRTFSHVNGSLALDFEALGLQQVGDESWGLDNIMVTLRAEVQQHETFLPLISR